MATKPIRLTMWKGRAGARDRTYFRLDVEAAAALMARILTPPGESSDDDGRYTVDGVARALAAGHKVTEAWDVEGARWTLTAARVVEGGK